MERLPVGVNMPVIDSGYVPFPVPTGRQRTTAGFRTGASGAACLMASW